MSQSTRSSAEPSQGVAAARPVQPVVYMLPSDSLVREDDSSVDLVGLREALWAGKWLILAVTLLFAAAAVAYGYVADPWYRADVLLIPAESRSTSGLSGGLSGLGNIGGLASLAGISVG